MKLGLFGVICTTLFLTINCDNDSPEIIEMKIKMDAMEQRLAKMDAMEKHIAKIDAMERQQKATDMRLAEVEKQQGKDKGF